VIGKNNSMACSRLPTAELCEFLKKFKQTVVVAGKNLAINLKIDNERRYKHLIGNNKAITINFKIQDNHRIISLFWLIK
jgi:hypothetical protein